MTDEIWKLVLSGHYSVSNFGRVRRETPSPINRGISYPGRLLTIHIVNGYHLVSTCVKGVPNRRTWVHRLVAEAFIGRAPTSKHVINHKNGIKADNRPDNLEWVTVAENNLHAYAIGLRAVGEQHHKAKLSEEAVFDIRQNYKKGITTLESFARKYQVTVSLVSCVVLNKIWLHLLKNH